MTQLSEDRFRNTCSKVWSKRSMPPRRHSRACPPTVKVPGRPSGISKLKCAVKTQFESPLCNGPLYRGGTRTKVTSYGRRPSKAPRLARVSWKRLPATQMPRFTKLTECPALNPEPTSGTSHRSVPKRDARCSWLRSSCRMASAREAQAADHGWSEASCHGCSGLKSGPLQTPGVKLPSSSMYAVTLRRPRPGSLELCTAPRVMRCTKGTTRANCLPAPTAKRRSTSSQM
mmetsp:Transcript_76660/g.199666  ORF Transcript_76660/g.199666 Transcript_76660/m.199666 type:complete len:230 (-) Transcript_76660:78-767(-)